MQYFCWTFCQLGFALDNLADEASYVVPQWFAVGSGALPVAVREPLEGPRTPEAGQYVDCFAPPGYDQLDHPWYPAAVTIFIVEPGG